MTGHVPRLIRAGHGYCAVCEHGLRLVAGTWQAVWSRSTACTGVPVRCGP